eukprot:7470312-Lingulodinium_polyedra.AAC.1
MLRRLASNYAPTRRATLSRQFVAFRDAHRTAARSPSPAWKTQRFLGCSETARGLLRAGSGRDALSMLLAMR